MAHKQRIVSNLEQYCIPAQICLVVVSQILEHIEVLLNNNTLILFLMYFLIIAHNSNSAVYQALFS